MPSHSSLPNQDQSKRTRRALILWFLVLAIVILGRILSPSDLGQNLDQSKTIAFTLDMIHNNQWILPSDGINERTRKPPMVNWVGAPIVALGIHTEWALKLPSILAGITTAIFVFIAARFLFRQLEFNHQDNAEHAIASNATVLAFFASCAWLASLSTIKQIYFMRPDLLFTAFLTIAWVCSILLLVPMNNQQSIKVKKQSLLALGIWLATACAILTKGPLAIFVPIYLLLHILLITPKAQRKSAINKLNLWWGIPLVLILPAIWLYAAYRVDPDHVSNALIGTELGSRVGRGGSSGILEALRRNPGFFIERFFPWCIPALFAVIFLPSRRFKTHPMGPAVLWFFVVMCTTTLFAMKSGSYIMPVYPAAAILAIYGHIRFFGFLKNKRTSLAIKSLPPIILVFALALTISKGTMSRGARNQAGEHIKAFASQAESIVQSDPVRYQGITESPIASLMGRFQAGEIEQTHEHRWLIAPTAFNSGMIPVLISDPIVTHDPDSGVPIDQKITVGLYQLNP